MRFPRPLDRAALLRIIHLFNQEGNEEGRLLRVLGKGNKQRTAPFGEPAAEALRVWLADGRANALRRHGVELADRELHDRTGQVLELGAAPRRYLRWADTEVVLRAYLEWGIACLARFAGMFALAIWDPVALVFSVRFTVGFFFSFAIEVVIDIHVSC